jgi:Protein of unknown function (DUF3887)
VSGTLRVINRGFVIVVALGLLLVNCSSGEDIAAAERGAERFRELLSAKEFSRIYSESGEEFRKGITEPDLSKFLTAVVNKLGPVKSAEKTTWSVNFQTSGTFVTLGYKTEFEKGTGSERFIFRVKNGAAALVRYDINSPALIIN